MLYSLLTTCNHVALMTLNIGILSNLPCIMQVPLAMTTRRMLQGVVQHQVMHPSQLSGSFPTGIFPLLGSISISTMLPRWGGFAERLYSSFQALGQCSLWEVKYSLCARTRPYWRTLETQYELAYARCWYPWLNWLFTRPLSETLQCLWGPACAATLSAPIGVKEEGRARISNRKQ